MGQYEGPCYSNVDLIKRLMVKTNRPLSFDEIATFVQRHWAGEGTSEGSARAMVNSALRAPVTRFKSVGNDLWVYSTPTADVLDSALHDRVYRILDSKSQPQSHRELVNALIASSSYTRTTVSRALRTLHTDLRFVQIESRFLLSKWYLINDMVYDYMLDRNIETALAGEIYEVVRTRCGIVDPEAIFAPSVDRRFNLESGGKIRLLKLSQTENAQTYREKLIHELIIKKLPQVVAYLRDHGFADTDYIMKQFFNARPQQKSYISWEKELVAELSQNENLHLRNKRWEYNRQVSSTMQDEHTMVTKDTEEQTGTGARYNLTVTISYEDLVRGELPLVWWHTNVLRLIELKVHTGITLNTSDGFVYDCWYDPDRKCIKGLGEYYKDNDIVAGTVFSLRRGGKPLHVVIAVDGIDDQIAESEAIYKGELSSRETELDEFALICDLVYHEGEEGIAQSVLCARSLHKSITLYSTKVRAVLQNNSCFYSDGDRWFLVPSKVGRYYINEQGRELPSQAFVQFMKDESNDQPAEEIALHEETLRQVQDRLKRAGQERGALSYEEIQSAVEEFGLSDDELNALYEEFESHGIDLISEMIEMDDSLLESPDQLKQPENRIVHVIRNQESVLPSNIASTPATAVIETSGRLKNIAADVETPGVPSAEEALHVLLAQRDAIQDFKSLVHERLSALEEQLEDLIRKVESNPID